MNELKKRSKRESKKLHWKGQIALPSILNKGKYPQSGKEIKYFSTISDIRAKFMQTCPNNQCSMLCGSKQLFP